VDKRRNLLLLLEQNAKKAAKNPNEPINLLMRLYAHDSASLELLKKCRINPDFRSKFRKDLEFFLPQLCSFFLTGGSEKNPEEFVQFFIMCATHSFYFSHRLWFFFQACLYANDADGAD
jgi:hypothetical protein